MPKFGGSQKFQGSPKTSQIHSNSRGSPKNATDSLKSVESPKPKDFSPFCASPKPKKFPQFGGVPQKLTHSPQFGGVPQIFRAFTQTPKPSEIPPKLEKPPNRRNSPDFRGCPKPQEFAPNSGSPAHRFPARAGDAIRRTRRFGAN